ncbi:CPBP family intramembrane metalloprotease [Clostridium sp. OM02-18AC]|nr:CPBP family intramembrane metalloprotease [Clostridium sp. AF32-12BH]RHV65933.1 CPBP family intramembrane metalloprotease [Clostridium sp. OM02-18AC]
MYNSMNTRRQISRICWIYTAFLAVSTAVQLFLGALLEPFVLIFGQSRAFTRAALLVSEFAMYGIGFPLFAWLMGRIPSCEMQEKKKISLSQFLGLLVLCYGFTYLGNLLGGILMEAAGTLRGMDYSNPVADLVDQMDLEMLVLTTVIIAPVMEELMFRKYLVERLVPYGQKTAVLFSGLLFGLFHGNFYQFFYAAILGAVFAWIYSSTGRLRYNIALHMCINFLGGVLPVVLSRAADSGNLFAYLGYGALNLFAYVAMVIAVILFVSHYKRISWFSGWVYQEEPMGITCLKSPGFWVFLAGCILLFLFG